MERSSLIDRFLRIDAAVCVVAGGLVHLKLWDDGYRHIDKIGPSFLLNAVASIVVGIAVATWRHWLPVAAALAVVDGTLLAFALSRTSRGVLDFTERGWNPSPEAAVALVVEVAAVALLGALLWMGRDRSA